MDICSHGGKGFFASPTQRSFVSCEGIHVNELALPLVSGTQKIFEWKLRDIVQTNCWWNNNASQKTFFCIERQQKEGSFFFVYSFTSSSLLSFISLSFSSSPPLFLIKCSLFNEKVSSFGRNFFGKKISFADAKIIGQVWRRRQSGKNKWLEEVCALVCV